MRNKAIVIGGGFSGLAVSAILAHKGWQVTLLEKNQQLGGRAQVLNKQGFSFDMGPSWYMMPEVFENYFRVFNKLPKDYYQLLRLNPRYKVFFSDGSQVRLSDDIQENARWFDQVERGAGNRLKSYLQQKEDIYKLATDKLMYEDPRNIRTWLNRGNLTSAVKLLTKVNLLQFWNRELDRYFRSEKLRQILGFSAVFLGGSPFNTPALYSILTWADFGKGVWYPRGGMGKVVEALEQLAREKGVEIVTGTEVNEIQIESGLVKGVKTQARFFASDVVVNSTDLAYSEQNLVPSQSQTYNRQYWDKKTLGVSALMIYLGLKSKIPGLVHHNIYFSRNWEKNFKEIFVDKVLPQDPSLYVSVRSVSDQSIVPTGSEEIIILVPLGAGTKYADGEIEIYAERVIDKLERVFKKQFRKEIVVKEIFHPRLFQTKYNSFQGTALGLAHTLSQSLWWRPGNKSKKVAGLYYTGQYTNPGVGVPMALISAQITANIIGRPGNDNNRIFKNGSTTYYYSSIFFPEDIKADVFCLYAYVRVMDDFVDRILPEKANFTRMWKETLKEWKHASSADPIVKQFVCMAKRRNFAWEWIESFHRAMEADLIKKRYDNYQELEEYMYGSAEVIGLMMARIMNLPKEADMTARLQGKAMQLINFVRDIKEDESLGRNYLGYQEEWKSDAKLWGNFLMTQINKYRELQQEAQKGYKFIPRRYLIPIKTAADIYSWTANQIAGNPSVVWQVKIKPNKLFVILKVVKNSLFL